MAVIGGSGAKTPISLLTGKRGLSYDLLGVQYTSGAKTIQLANNESLQTTLNVTGSGTLTLVYFFSDQYSTGARIQITLDGVVVLNESVSDSNGGIANYGLSPVGIVMQGNGTAGKTCARDYIPFSTSLKIECQAINDGRAAYLAVDYQLTS